MKKKEKKYGLLKIVLIMLLVAIVLSWVIPNGQFSESAFTDGGMRRIGLNDLSWLIYYGIAYSLDKIVLLLSVGGLYGVLSKTNAYERLVSGIAKVLSKHKKLWVVILSVLIAGLTSVLIQSFAVIIFIPIIISILKRMNLDKMTILATTFGSMLVGIMGATYGTEGVMYLDQYVGSISANTTLVRTGILAIGLVLFNFFTLTHIDKTEKNAESVEMFEVEVSKDTKKQTIIPIVIIGIITFALVILGFLNWSGNFGIEAFENFHTMITEEVKIGKDFYIFNDLLGPNMEILGNWDLFSVSAIVLVFTGILGLCYRIKITEFLENFVSGLKKMLKPIACVVGAFILFVIVYMSPYVATILNWILGLTKGFNLITMFIVSLISSIFHTDLGFTGYIAGSYLVTNYADYSNPIFTMLTSMYGFVQFFVPTSIILGVGLTSLNVKYTDWLKYIWKFLVGILVCLIVVFILMTTL